ncbi:PGF-pre-PGF domain-containing protein [Candidatus Woesearchaeota archaeon]|nr:PGF-pre-PGF domain-containing protein [Candidatus Woesearchaeota archaeon]
MKKGDFSAILNSQNGKVNLALLISVVLIFVLSIFYVEAMTVRLFSPGNFTFNTSAVGKNVSIAFAANWSGGDLNTAENVSNCSLYLTSSPYGLSVDGAARNVSRDAMGAGNLLQNFTSDGTILNLSYINFTFPGEGNFTFGISCLNYTNSSLPTNVTFSANFSFFLDAAPPSFNFSSPDKTKNSTMNLSSTQIVPIRFTLNDSGYGLNMSRNNSINLSIIFGGAQFRFFAYVNNTGSDSNLSCTGVNSREASTATVTCNASFNFLSNGTYILNISAADALGNVNMSNIPASDTVVKVTVDQIPPKFDRYNITHNGTLSPDEGSSSTAELGLGAGVSTAQGRAIYALSNWTDNLTQVFQGVLQFYNETRWQTLKDTNDNVSKGARAFNVTNWINLSFDIPVGHNDFEGRNVSFRIIANDTLGNVNGTAELTTIHSGGVKFFNITINDTTKPTVSINGSISINGIGINGSNISSSTILASWIVNEPSRLSEINVSIDSATVDTNLCNFFVRYANPASGGSADPDRFRNFSKQTNPNPTEDPSGLCSLANGTHTIAVSTRDIWGNVEVVYHDFNVQTGAPGLFFNNVTSTRSIVNNTNLTSGTGGTAATGLTFFGRAGRVSVSNLSYVSSCNSSATVYFSNNTIIYPFNESSCATSSGNVTLTVTVRDNAGNSNSTIFGFLVDNVAPTIAVDSPRNGQTFTDVNTTLNLSVYDNDQPISFYGYYLDGSLTLNTINTSTRIGDPGVNTSDLRLINFTPGTHTIKFTANDTLGNVRNSSIITFTVGGPLNFDSLGFNDSLGHGNTSLGLYNVNMSLVNLTNASNEPIRGTLTVIDRTLNLFMALNTTTKGVNVTITFNASAANWDKYNFTVKQNDSDAINHINNNWTTTMKDILWFNESIQEFLSNNNSYYAKVKYPINASVDIIGGQFEIWYFKDIKDLTAKTNVTECSAAFNPGFTFTESSACWNNTDNHSVNIFLPHFSLLAFTNNSLAPTGNVSFPTSPNQSTSMFIPNITVSADTVTCKYHFNGSGTATANITMTKTGNICIGQTERFKNQVETPAARNITFWLADDDGNTNQYVWGFNITDDNPPNSPNSSRISTSVTSTTSTITISGINETVNVTVNYGTSSTALGTLTMQTDFNQSQEVSITGLTASTLYHFNVSVCDFNNNCAQNGTFNFTTSAAAAAAAASTASSSSGGGGGGGAAASNVQASAGRQWDTLAAGSSGVLAINNANIAVTGVVIEIANTVSNPSMEVQSLTSNPLTAAAAAKVYQYLQLVKSNIADSDASKITISFKVPKSWLTSNSVAEDDIILYRYSGQWNALPTTKISSDGDYVTYQSTTPGFSTFAIGSKEAAPVTAPPTEAVPEAPPTPPTEAPPTPEAPPAAAPSEEAMEEKGLSNTAIGWIVVLVIVVVAGVGYFMWQKKQER